MGTRHTITNCERNILIELDGRPALDVFSEDIGEVLARDLSRVAGYVFAGLPVPASDTGDYLVRNLVGIDTERKMLAIGDLVKTVKDGGTTALRLKLQLPDPSREVEMMLGGHFDVSPKQAGALKALPGVLEVEAF